MPAIYLSVGFVAFWILVAAAAALALAALVGLVVSVAKAYWGARDWIALAAVDRFTGLTKEQRDAAYHRVSEKLYTRDGFDAKRGMEMIAFMREIVADMDRAKVKS